MESSLIDLSKYRFQSSQEDFDAAMYLLNNGNYRASVNRSYYAIFHALRAVTALDGFDSSKHSGIIAYFNKNYVKESIFDKSISKNIDSIYRLRECADYKDFYVVSKEQALEQYEKARVVLKTIHPYLNSRWDMSLQQDKSQSSSTEDKPSLIGALNKKVVEAGSGETENRSPMRDDPTK